MSEQRFIAIHGVKYHRIEDDEKGYVYYSEDAQSIDLLVGLLNEQQATNDYLEEANSRLQIQLGETLRLVDEQQATIRKLQDLCGESDSENAKLRQEIKELKAQLREKEQDEQLYANEIVKLNKEAKEVLDFKSLGGDY